MVAILKRLDATALGRASIAEIRGRPTRMTGGSHLADLASLGKAIILTELEARRWNPDPYGYVRHPAHPRITGYSDATGTFCDGDGILFIRKES